MRIFSNDHLNPFTTSKRFFVYTSLALLGIAILSIGSIDNTVPVGFGYIGNTDDHNTDDHNTDDHNTDDHNTDDHNTDDHNTDDHNTDDHNTDDH
ncbi:MAG TPA: hypothetical protein VH500_20845, partial [Nitrososphaeraceae archaeon]